MIDDDNTPKTMIRTASNTPYILAVVIMMILGVGGIMVLTVIRPNADNTMLIATMLGFLAPTTLSLLAFMKAQETHLSVNSRLDAFMEQARATGHAAGITDERARADRKASTTRTGKGV